MVQESVTLQLPASTSPVAAFVIGAGCDHRRRVLQGGDEAGAVASIISEPIDLDLIVRIAGQIVDLELHRAANVGADGGRKAFKLGRILARVDLPDTLGVPGFWFSSTIGLEVGGSATIVPPCPSLLKIQFRSCPENCSVTVLEPLLKSTVLMFAALL